jgi:UDP-N-acetylglucosamine diphosphorylase/glucosamine-1-phosphate N-acetyltransferase
VDHPGDDPPIAVSPPLVLIDPPQGPFWPLAATRPVAALLGGARTFHARWSQGQGQVAALLCDPEVSGCAFRSGAPAMINAWPDPTLGYRVAVSTWLPPREWIFGDAPATHVCQGTPVAWRLDTAAARRLARQPAVADSARETLRSLDLPATEGGGRSIDSIWELVEHNAELLIEDAADFTGAALEPEARVAVIGPAPRAAAGGPFAVLDSTVGPILLDHGARVTSHASLRGPLYVGPGSAILGGEVGGGTSIGPDCKVRGEVERTIFQGYANKAHDGFVGHSVLGEWVNLGAGTTTSDLKNTYGPVRVEGPAGRVDTGLLKVGSFLGDHVKTGIGSLLTTGARLGVATHFFGGRGMSPTWLPNFSWFDGADRQAVRFEDFRRAAGKAMARRGQQLESGEEAILLALAACSARRGG